MWHDLARPLLSCCASSQVSNLSRQLTRSLNSLGGSLEMNLKTAGIALAAGALLTTSAFAAATKQVTREQHLRAMDPTMAKAEERELAPTGKGIGVSVHGQAKPTGGSN